MSLDALQTDNDGEPPVKLTMLQAFWKELERIWKKEVLKGTLSCVTDEQFKHQIGPVKPYLRYMTTPLPDEMGRFYKNFYRPGAICTVGALPFTKNCVDVQELQQQGRLQKPTDSRHFFYVFVTDPATRETRGFNDRPGHFFDLLSDRMKKDLNGNDLEVPDPPAIPGSVSPKGGMSFMISYPSDDDDENREWLANQLAKGMENFIKFVHEAPAN